MANNTLIGALRAEATLESGKFVDGAKKIQNSAKKTESQLKRSFGGMGSSIKAFGTSLVAGLSVGLIARGIKSALDYAGSLKEVAQQLGVTTRELQVFRYAVQQNGGTAEQADQALGKFAISISNARRGSAEAAKSFKAAGVSLADLETKSKLEILGKVADKFKATGGAAANAKTGVEIFGKGFLKIVPTLDLGSKGLSEVAAAAEKLGIILDEKLIDQADEAADKVDALQTVLKAQIAGAVAENAGAIVELADSLVYLVAKIADALRWWSDFVHALDAQAYDLSARNPFLSKEKRERGAFLAAQQRGLISDSGEGWGVAGNRVAVSLKTGGPVSAAARAAAKKMGQKIVTRSSAPEGSPSPIEGGGGRSRRDDTERKRQQALRDAYQFDQELLRAQMDIVRAQQQLSTDYTERANLGIELLNLEQLSFQREMEFAVASGELSKAQAAQLIAENAKRDALERQAIREEEQAQRLEDYNDLEILDLELRRDELAAQERLAETATEARDVRLRLLDLDYRIERARLEQVLADEKASYAAKEDARRRLASLNQTQPRDRAAAIQGTRGPMEDYLAGLPTTAAKAQEALEQLQVQGFEGLIDAALALTDGFDSAKDALLSTLKQFFLGLARMELQKALGSFLPSIGFASGGYTGNMPGTHIAGFVHGREGVLNMTGMRTLGIPNLEALNRGAPLSSVSNDNDLRRSGGSKVVNQTFNFPNSDYDSFRRSEGQMARSAKRRLG